jgi:glycine/D-amino acid oxidase-like deaminating enzyme/nitrite reductase/ring-hydroxylating ferredoxin subunit
MNTTPYWIDSAPLPEFPAVDGDCNADVVVVGGGITGVTAAYLLKRAGCRVILLERERCASLDTGHTTAHLTHVLDTPLHELEHNFGPGRAQMAWRAARSAIDQIEANIAAESIECEFRRLSGFLHAPVSGEDGKGEFWKLKRDTELANQFGFRAQFMNSVPMMKRPGVEFANQAVFHPRKYVAGLLRAIPGQGSAVFEHTAVDEISEKPLTVRAGRSRIRCDFVVIATHTPLRGHSGMMAAILLQTKLFLYTTYVLGARIASGIVPDAIFWDTSDPYYYLRVDHRGDHDYVIFGGEDHKTGQETDTVAVFERLESRLKKLLPRVEVDRRWSGQVVETPDGIPYIGKTAEDQFAATGFAGQGMAFGTVGAMMATDAYLKRDNPWKDLFAPGRKALRAGKLEYARENVDYPYYLLRGWLGPAEEESLNAVKSGEGRIIALDHHKVAAYRDEQGHVTLLSPVCTHLRCIVRWNSAEKTWDCPCHGSRYKATGEVIAGPAEEDLKKIPVPEHVTH